MDFYQQVGKLALGSRLRRLSDRLTEDAVNIYELYDVSLDPKWFPVFYVLSRQAEASITEIAQMIGHSHPSVSQIVKEMKKKGIAITGKHRQDARVSVVRLSDTGKALIPKLEKQCEDVEQAAKAMLQEIPDDLWRAIASLEFQLSERSFFQRVQAVRKQQEQHLVEIIDYAPGFRDDFKRLNYEWIEQYFQIEDADRQALEHPDEKILDPGGHIYMACYRGEVVGTCALIRLDNVTYELAKMAVTEGARGKGVGWLLGQAAIAKARELGAQQLYLESNTALQPAIRLYQKLGFQQVVGKPSPYARCNIQMTLPLNQ